MAKEIEWRYEKRKVSELVPADYNPRRLSEIAKADLMKSVTRFGMVEPVVINTNDIIIGGHQRITVYADLGIEEVNVMVPSRKLSDKEERELNVRLNKNVGEWDYSKLQEFFGVDELLDYGFGEDELSRFFDNQAAAEEDDYDADKAAESIVKPVSQLGDVWELGGHRVTCGDSTSKDVYAALFDGSELADMVFTDPPYNINYDHAQKYKVRGKNKVKYAGGSKVINDKMKPEEFQDFLVGMFRQLYEWSKDSMSIYVCHATKSQAEFFSAFKISGYHYSQTIIWLKERIVLTMGQDFQRVYEPILYGWKEGKKHWKNTGVKGEREVWDLDRKDFEERLDVWQLNRDNAKEYRHPTQKPVRLPERAIKKGCPIGGIVLEPFGGSGSTLLACEQLSRRCFAIELDPRYCDVIIDRWQKYTGKQATCLTRPEAEVSIEV